MRLMHSFGSAFFALVLVATPALAQEGGTATADEMARMQEISQKYTSPGPEHASLEALVGPFGFTSSFKKEPGAEAMTMNGTAEYSWIHGGRYLEQTASGSMMNMPFAGTGYLGFDRFRGEYFSMWIDNMSTGYSLTKGHADESGRVITFEGSMDDVWEGKKDVWVKTVLTIRSEDAHLLEMFVKGPDGKAFKNFEIEYKRAKLASN